jgi:hypothetical protein
MGISTALFQMQAQAKQQANQIVAADKLLQEAVAQKEAMFKDSHKTTSKFLEATKQAQDREAAEKLKPPQTFGFITNIINTGNSAADNLAKAITSCDTHLINLTLVNSAHKAYYGAELPRHLNDLQDIEEARLEHVKQKFTELAALFEERSVKAQAAQQLVRGAAELLNTHKDISSYLVQAVTEHGSYQPPTAFEYNLGVSPAEIKSGIVMSLVRTQFRVSLQRCMDFQAGTSELKYPRIVHVCIQDIIRKGGLTSQGIFRLSIPSDELGGLCAQFDTGNYVIRSQDPNSAACLLKKWLRDLAEPVFPEALYPEVTPAHAQTQTHRKIHTQVLRTGQIRDVPHDDKHPVMGVFAQLPEINRLVISEIAGLVQQVFLL